MFARLSSARKAAARIFTLMSAMWLAACDPVGLVGANDNTGQRIDPNAPVQVALLVPGGSGAGSDSLLASNLENAARLAISDLNGVRVDLRIYNTGADPLQAASVASRAVDEGAKIILGPLFAEAANAAGVAVAPRNVNVLAFSNNPTIAGGNVFVLGATFQNTANRLVQYSKRQGISRYMIVHGNDLQGQVGRDAIASAVRNNGGEVAGIESYPLSQQGIVSATSRIAAATKSGGANAVFMTAGVNADLPILATSLPEAGVNPASTRYIGLTRWNAAPQALALPGLQGGLFALPDQTMSGLFESRYNAAYGSQPHPLAGLAYDGIAAIGALIAKGNANTLTKQALTSPQGFQGTAGIFRLLPNGLNERGLAVATIRNNQVVVLEQAPRSFGGAGF
ncbi:MAG: penicillin-binding protein activator [Yoonia sp.]|nr:penicillin-binding protein activator [Yoonia sp.]